MVGTLELLKDWQDVENLVFPFKNQRIVKPKPGVILPIFTPEEIPKNGHYTGRPYQRPMNAMNFAMRERLPLDYVYIVEVAEDQYQVWIHSELKQKR